MSKRILEESEIRDSENKRNRPETPFDIKKHGDENQCPCASLGNLNKYSSDILNTNANLNTNFHQDTLQEHLHTTCGGGQEQENSISDLNRSFLEECYPNLSEEVHSWPLTFEPKHSSDSTSDLREGAYRWPPTMETNLKFGKYNQRRGDEAEQKTFLMMRAMLKLEKIPSFTISAYEWMKYLPLELLDDIKKQNPEDTLKEGESDLLVLVPTKGVLVVEVKAATKIKEKTVKQIIEKCFTDQCMKAIKCVAHLAFDFIAHKQIVFIKIASLPNCSRSSLTNFTCGKCRLHYITKDDLESTDTLSKWFRELTFLLPRCEFDFKMYAGIVSRFIGPQSRVQVKVISRVTHDIDRELALQGPHEPSKSKWVQLNKAQWETVQENPRFLWITGDPGTGKTVLAQWKIHNIFKSELPEKHVVYFVAGNKDMLFIENMRSTFASHLKDTGKFELRIEPFETLFPETSDWNGLQGVMNVVERLKLKHEGSFLSVIIDEFWTIKNDGVKGQHDLGVDSTLLQNVWIIQNPLCKEIPDPSDLQSFHFKTVELKKVMRLSVSNVKFVNQWLSKEYNIGHAIQGPLPILYKMECICKKLQCEEEPTCIPFLIRKLTEEYIANYQKTWPKGNFKISISEDVVVITNTHIKVKKLLMKKHLRVTARPALYFTGCEKKVVIVDVRNVGGSRHYESNIAEALTRTTGSLVLLDVSCANDTLLGKFTEHIYKLHECSKKGFIESNSSITFSEAEINMLRREIHLGLHRDEHEIQENLGSAVTGKMLLSAIAPLKNDIRNVSKEVSENKQVLQRIEDKFSEFSTNLPTLIQSALQSNHVSGVSEGDNVDKPSIVK